MHNYIMPYIQGTRLWISPCAWVFVEKLSWLHPCISLLSNTANVSRGKTLVVVHKTDYSLENFSGASGQGQYILYKATDSRGKPSRLANNL